MRVFTNIFLLLICSQAFSQIQQESDSLELWTIFTSGDFVNDNAYKIASKNWPFKYRSVAGDAFTEEYAVSVNDHNKKLWEALSKKGYVNPEENFYRQFESERNRIVAAKEIVINNPNFKRLFKNISAENRINYTQLRKVSDTIYIFEIFSFDMINLSIPEKFEKRFTVDLNTKSIIKEK